MPPLSHPSVPHLTFILTDVPPAGHPAVTLVLELEGGGHNTDGLDVLVVGDRGGQLQQGNVAERRLLHMRVRDDVLHSEALEDDPQVPERWAGGQLAELGHPIRRIAVSDRGGESS